MDLTVRLPEPHQKQLDFLRCGKKRVCVRAGRRGGKTTGMSILAVEKFLAGRRVLYATPTQEQVDAFWEACKNALQETLDNGTYYKNETRHIIELRGTRQRIRAKTAWNADTLRGDSADLLIMDEYQLMNEDAWKVVGAPMLLDNDGDAVFVYTPPSLRTAGVSKAKDKRHAAKLFQRAENDSSGRWAAFHFTSRDNPYISTAALVDIAEDMTNLSYRQEILAEDIDQIPGALWTRELLDGGRVTKHLPLVRIVIGVDPKAAVTADSETGIVVAGVDENDNVYVLDDASLDGTPDQWARQVASAYQKWQADRIIVERNQGGDMVKATLQTVDANLPIREVHASRGKATRAEPIAAMYEQGKVKHVGEFPALEDQMCSWVPGEKSPDRLDACVWALTELTGRRPRKMQSRV